MNATTRPVLDPARELASIAQAVSRLSPSWQRPELFHEAKSEISARLRRLAGLADGQPWPWSPLSRRTASVSRVIERVRVVHVPMPRRYLRAPTRHRYPRPPRLPETVQSTLLLVPDHG